MTYIPSRITADTMTLLEQAPMTANDYMFKAIDDIDKLLGKGYAKQHPELIAAYMQTAAIDFATAIIARAIEGLTGATEDIGRALERRDYFSDVQNEA